MRQITWAVALVVAVGCGSPSPTVTDRDQQPTANPQTETKQSGDLAVELTSVLGKSSSPSGRPDILPRFSSAAKSSGIEFTFFSDIVADRYYLPEIMGGGAAWLDYDRDGWLDLYLADGCPLESRDTVPTDGSLSTYHNRLYRNEAGQEFEDVSDAATAYQPVSAGLRYGQGLAVADYDADGFPDIYVANFGANVLLRNNGDGTFTDVSAEAGVADPLWTTSPVWLDLNGDANLDLYVVNYLRVTRENIKVCEYDGVPGYCGPGNYEAAPNRVYISHGDGTFREAAEPYGLIAPGGKGLACEALDFDQDLRPEIYVANDMMENFLFTRSDTYRRDASGERVPFMNIAMQAGCAVSGTGENEASMGVACADFDGDQLVDIFLTHYYANKNTLYRNLGSLAFHDDSHRTRVAATSYETLGFGTSAFDYDRDMYPDLLVANGHVLGPKHSPNEMPPQLLRNDGGGRFTDISKFAGFYFQQLWLGRGIASGDYDEDGDLDFLVTHIGKPVELLRNDTETNRHWVGVELGTPERVPPVGGRVEVVAGDRRQTLPVVAGGSYLCSSDSRLLFGLADWSEPVQVTVSWPSGRVDKVTLAVDRYWRLIEGKTPVPVETVFDR